MGNWGFSPNSHTPTPPRLSTYGFRIQKTRSSLGDERAKSVVPPRLDGPPLIKKPCRCCDREMEASLTRFWRRRLKSLISFALITVATPAQATLGIPISPYHSKGHSTPAYARDSHLHPFSGPSFRRLLILFNVLCI